MSKIDKKNFGSILKEMDRISAKPAKEQTKVEKRYFKHVKFMIKLIDNLEEQLLFHELKRM